MTDVLPRLDGAFDGSDRRTLDRRQLLRAGAWAAPVLVLATASPAAAVVSQAYTIVTGNVLAFQNVTIYTGKQGTGVIKGNFGYRYSFNGWPNPNWGNPGPLATITTSWVLTVRRKSEKTAIATKTRTATLTMIGKTASETDAFIFEGLATGDYEIDLTVTASDIIDGNTKYVITPINSLSNPAKAY